MENKIKINWEDDNTIIENSNVIICKKCGSDFFEWNFKVDKGREVSLWCKNCLTEYE